MVAIPNVSKSIRKNCESRDRKARFCARWSPLRAQKRPLLACPVLYRNGALGANRTRDPILRRNVLYPLSYEGVASILPLA
jgi:hypothetical protein